MTIFTCVRCGAQGDPPGCAHFQRPWTMAELANKHRMLRGNRCVVDDCVREATVTVTLTARGETFDARVCAICANVMKAGRHANMSIGFEVRR